MDNNRKLRILHVLKSSIYSGAENVVITIIKSLREEFDMVYVATDGEIRTRLEQEHIPMELLTEFNRRELNNVVQKYQPDVVHAHDFSATVLCASIKGTFRLISHLHYDPPWVTKWNVKTIAFRMCKFRIGRVITVTNKAFESMVFADAYSDRHLALSNPIDKKNILRLAEMSPEDDCDTIDIDGLQKCDLIFVGRIVEQKNPQRFIHIIDMLKKRGFVDICAWMLGDGELRNECEEMIEELGLQNNIRMIGFQKNP